MKPLFVCLFFSFLLTFTADIAAQEVKQNAATAAKMPTKSVASGSVAPTAAPSSASKPATSVVKKAKKTVKPTSDKPASKGLFDDDYDGEVGIKYIGTEPASDEELARVKEVERNAKAVKPTKSVSKPATSPTPRVEKAKMTDATMEATSVESDVISAPKGIEKAKAVEVKSAPKVAEKAKAVEVKSAPKVVEKTKAVEVIPAPKVAEKAKDVEVKSAPKVAEKTKDVEVKSEPKAVEQTNVSEVKYDPIEVKSSPKPAVKPASKSVTRGARMEFDAITIDLGNIKEDAILERYFEFTNTGSSNLEILECRGSCGCIQPRAESTIVAAGERGRIYVKYVARNKVGPQKPVVTLTTNGVPSVMRLFIETWVEQIPGGVKDPNPAPAKSENN